MIRDEKRLREALGAAELEWLVDRVRNRLELGKPAAGVVSLQSSSPKQREALGRILGRRDFSGKSLSVRLEEVEALLCRAGICDSLVDAVEALTGPLVDREAEEKKQRDAWGAIEAQVESAAEANPALGAWWSELVSLGVLRRLSGDDPAVARPLVRRALEVIARLPAAGIPLPELAATVTGDSHGLDKGSPVATLVLRYAGRLAGIDDWTDAAARREVWAKVGVLCDELSSTVTVLGLTSNGGGLVDETFALHAAAGEPLRLTLSQLFHHPPRFMKCVEEPIFVCENITVLAAAASRLGPGSRPLICTDGQPSLAAILLLESLAREGAELYYHGDFDWPGLHIARRVMDRTDARPWRFGAADYLEAPAGPPLKGKAANAPWDDRLASTMERRGVAVHEELVLEELLFDLRR